MIRVGFVVSSSQTRWMGGTNYLRNLLYAIHTLPDCSIDPVLITGHDTPDEVIDGFPPVEMLRTSLTEARNRFATAGKVLGRLGRNLIMERLLRQHGISALSHSMHLGRFGGIPTIGWIPDFQHIHLPEFFSAAEIASRDAVYNRMCVLYSRIVVSSADVQRDLVAFAPKAAHKTRVLRFVARPAAPGPAVDLAELQARYGFSTPYIFLPNQFWAHKNHRVVVDALALLKRRGHGETLPLVICTGHTNDSRRPDYFPALMRHVEEQGIGDAFRPLGLVPFADVVALMRHSRAVLNPSRFEGWSTSVEEGKAMGKQVILSDLPVHREQAPASGLYFSPDNPEALADCMLTALATYDPAEDARRQAAARAALPGQVEAFGARFQEIVRELVPAHTR